MTYPRVFLRLLDAELHTSGVSSGRVGSRQSARRRGNNGKISAAC
jgi:hypothetical protein